MNTSIFISSYRKDFPWLKYCIRSINKFCIGFYEVVIQFPDTDWDEFTRIIGPEIMGQNKIRYFPIAGKEWPEKGFLWHEAQIMHADKICKNADFISHFDSDAIFTEPVTPETFIENGKPYLQYESFDSISKRHPGVLRWQECTQKCLPFDVLLETMRGLPHTYEINTYEKARDLMMLHTQMDVNEYIMGCVNSFPQTFCEHVTLGSVAVQCFPNDYITINMGHQENKDLSRYPVRQHWSHGDMKKPQQIWVYGKEKVVIPTQVFSEYGLENQVIA